MDEEFVEIRMALSGLIIGGRVRQKGEVVEKPPYLPSSPKEQMDKWKGKVYYVEVGSVHDTVATKNALDKQEQDLSTVSNVLIQPVMNDQGAGLLGENTAPLTEEDLPNVIPDYYESDEEGDEEKEKEGENEISGQEEGEEDQEENGEEEEVVEATKGSVDAVKPEKSAKAKKKKTKKSK